MKKTLIRFMLCGLPLLFFSCFRETDFGFPKTVTFSNVGGELTLTGDKAFSLVEIRAYKDETNTDLRQFCENGMIYDWLKVEGVEIWNNDTVKCLYYNDLKLIAEPNTTGRSRTLYVDLYSGPEYAVVKVVQQK